MFEYGTAVHSYLLFAMEDRLYDVSVRTHTLGGEGPKRLVTTWRVTYRGGAGSVWGVTKQQKVAKRLAVSSLKTALKIAPTFNQGQHTHERIATRATHMCGTTKR